MLNKIPFELLTKRKSFHSFGNKKYSAISKEELDDISMFFESTDRLYPDIKLKIRIVREEDNNRKHDGEYFIMIYSEKKDNYLLNAGYVGEQLDLYLISKGIGTLWYGLGKPDEDDFEGLSYVIMFSIKKVCNSELFREDNSAKRNKAEDIWQGNNKEISEVVRFAPSAVNTQPWKIVEDNGVISVYRHKKTPSILPSMVHKYFNRIDMGIFLCFLDIALLNRGIKYTRDLFIDKGSKEDTLVAKYNLLKEV